MPYKELRQFMSDVFRDQGRKILDLALRESGITDIDAAQEAKRKALADYVLREHLNFSAQKNRYLYEQLLRILGLRGISGIEEYKATVKGLKKKEIDIVLTSMDSFWEEVQKAYYKYEIIINVFWLKGVEAEMSGVNREFVDSVVNKAIVSVKHDLRQAYSQLLDDLYLKPYIRKHSYSAKKIFDIISVSNAAEVPDENNAFLLNSVQSLMTDVESTFDRLELLMVQSIRQLAEHSAIPNERYIEQLKYRITGAWTGLSEKYQKKYKELADFSSRLTA